MPEAARRIRAVLADDEEIARTTLRGLLARDASIEVVAECKNGLEAVDAVRAHAPDLLILDVQMPGLGGLEVLERLAAEDSARVPLVIFATAYDRYALEAFDRAAVDYVLKPFDDERFLRAIERAKARFATEAAADAGRRVAELLSHLGRKDPASGAPARRLALHRGGRIDYIDVAEIEWIEASDQYVQVHVAGSAHLMRESMDRVERMLDPERFVRVHRSAIVPLARIKSLEMIEGGGARVLMADGKRLPVSRSRVADLKVRLG